MPRATFRGSNFVACGLVNVQKVAFHCMPKVTFRRVQIWLFGTPISFLKNEIGVHSACDQIGVLRFLENGISLCLQLDFAGVWNLILQVLAS